VGLEYLVRWRHWDSKDDTWEHASKLEECEAVTVWEEANPVEQEGSAMELS
jgi:hypothetical protein